MKNKFDSKAFANIQGDFNAMQYLNTLLQDHKSAILGDSTLCSCKFMQKNIFDQNEHFMMLENDMFVSYTVALDDINFLNKQENLSTHTILQYLNAPIESLLHALLPYTFVQNSALSSVITVSHLDNSAQLFEEFYGNEVLVVPYANMDFEFIQVIKKALDHLDLEKLRAIIIEKTTVITFGNSVEHCYNELLYVEEKASQYLLKSGAVVCGDDIEKTNKSILGSLSDIFEKASNCILDVYKGKNKEIPLQTNLEVFAYMRKKISENSAMPMLASLDESKKSVHFSNVENLSQLIKQTPLTPNSVVELNNYPMLVNADTTGSIQEYVNGDEEYCNIPAWAVWENFGTIAFAHEPLQLEKRKRLVSNTISSILKIDTLQGYRSFSQNELEQINNNEYIFEEEELLYTGKVAIVTNCNNLMGQTLAQRFEDLGAVVVRFEENVDFNKSIPQIIKDFGGIDIVISNPIIANEERSLQQCMQYEFDAHKDLLDLTLPFLKLGIDPTFVYLTYINKKSVGCATANAAMQTYTKSIAAQLEEYGIRINCILSNDEVQSNTQDVAQVLGSLCSNDFAKTTGTTIIVDGARNLQIG